MNSRERMFALLNRELPDRMGIFEHFWPETIPLWQQQGFPEDQSPEDYFDYDLRNAAGWLDTTPFRGVDETIEETDEWRVARDGRGAALKHWKHHSGTPEHIGFTVTDREKWKEYREPLLHLDTSRFDPQATREGCQRVRDAGKFAFLGNLFVVELLRGTLGDMIFLQSMLLDPDWIRDFCEVYLNFFKTHYAALFEKAGLPDGMFIYEDLGYTNGLFCSPQILDELIMPAHRELVGFFKSYNLPVLLHTCGDIREAVPLIVDAGYDCLQPMEAKAGCDVVQLAETYRDRISFMGNMDVTVLNTNDKDRVRAEVENKVNAMKRLGAAYIFHSDHSIPPDIHFETYEFAVELFREIGVYG